MLTFSPRKVIIDFFSDCQAISDGYLKLSDQSVHAEDGCIISYTFGLPPEVCLHDCDLDPDCQAVSYANQYSWCRLLRCYDLSTKYDLHALLVDSFIKACPENVLGKLLFLCVCCSVNFLLFEILIL